MTIRLNKSSSRRFFSVVLSAAPENDSPGLYVNSCKTIDCSTSFSPSTVVAPNCVSGPAFRT